MKHIISTVIMGMFFFSCSPREFYAIDAKSHPEFVLQTKNYELNDIVESKLEKMKNDGNVLEFDRRDSQNVTYFKIQFAPKDSIKLKTLLMYGEPDKGTKVINIKAKPEFLLFSEMNGNKDTVYYKKGRHEYVNQFQFRTRKFLGYRFYPN
ncbi:MAG: hypothetical protein ABI374_08665 [Ginsengibacter sp.]